MAEISIVGGKGQHHKGCICTDNIDVQSGRCAVTHNAKGNFDKGNACSYCYARYLFKDNYSIKPPISTEDLQKRIQRREKQKIKDDEKPKKVKHIRLGKIVEIWDTLNPIESKATLLSVMQAANALKKPIMMMTKLMSYDKDIATELQVLDSALHYSLGNDEFELGAVAQGMTNKERIKQAKKYHKTGCNVYLRLVVDVVQPMTKEHKKLENTGIPLLITPLRYSTKKLFESNVGLDWDEAEAHGYKYNRGSLQPQQLHESWGDKTDHAYCGVVGNSLGCNSCGLYTGRKRWIKE